MKQLVIGLGEVGSAIQNILGCDGYDVNGGLPQEAQYDVLHICFPYSDGFAGSVKAYMLEWKPSLVVVHSSVPVGTCDKEGWVHSPIRGVHPNLEQGIKTFVKYFGCEDAKLADKAAEPFRAQGINCFYCPSAAETEALKLWDTTQYGIQIMLEKHIHDWCEKHGLDSSIIYTHANCTYNYGYTRLGMEHVVRPFLNHMDGPIGGHCVIPNAHLLDSELAKLLIEFNTQL
jgi:UDP-N-acetyl-D-mannosaminuronate dehydrogenase